MSQPETTDSSPKRTLSARQRLGKRIKKLKLEDGRVEEQRHIKKAVMAKGGHLGHGHQKNAIPRMVTASLDSDMDYFRLREECIVGYIDGDWIMAKFAEQKGQCCYCRCKMLGAD